MRELEITIPLTYIRLEHNIGGAGGFYTGMKRAYDTHLYDAVWVMDDDGEPDSKCLSNLLKYVDEYPYISPLVVCTDDDSKLAFGTLGSVDVYSLKDKYQNGIIFNHANPFNGVLLSNDFIEKVGFPKKEMFIWGDENEYEARGYSRGFTSITVLDAIHKHPKDRLVLYKDFLGREKIIWVESELRRYCKYRNTAYVLKTYKGWLNLIFYIFRYSLFFMINRRLDCKGFNLFLKAVSAGITNQFEGHWKYIRR